VIGLYEECLLQATIISASFILISFIVIIVLYQYAYKQLRLLDTSEKDIKKQPVFWMERILLKRFKQYGFKAYIVFSFAITSAVMVVSYLSPILVAGPNPWWWTIKPMLIAHNTLNFILLGFSILMGFLVPSRLYHYFVNDVMKDMNKKANKTSQPKKVTRRLNMFALVAGGSSIYQVICIVIACALFVVMKLFNIIQWQQTAGIVGGLDIRPLLTDWIALLLYAFIGGIVGPMATTISAFIVYCGITFKSEGFFDSLEKDRRGGFGSLGTLGMGSAFMAAVTPGIAIPVLFLNPKTEAVYETATNLALLLFLMICVSLFFFVPIHYVHTAMKTSRAHEIQKFEKDYRPKLDKFLKRVGEEKKPEMVEAYSILVLKGTYDTVATQSDWPIDYLTILEVVASVLLPSLGYILKFLMPS